MASGMCDLASQQLLLHQSTPSTYTSAALSLRSLSASMPGKPFSLRLLVLPHSAFSCLPDFIHVHLAPANSR